MNSHVGCLRIVDTLRIPVRTIRAYEHGEYLPGAWALATLCPALGISPAWLLDAEPGATNEETEA